MAWGGTSSNPVLCTTASGCTVHGMELGNRWTLVGGGRGIYQEGWVLSPTGTFKIPRGMRDTYSGFPWIIHLTHVLESGVSIMFFRRTGPMARSTWDNGVAWLNAKFLLHSQDARPIICLRYGPCARLGPHQTQRWRQLHRGVVQRTGPRLRSVPLPGWCRVL